MLKNQPISIDLRKNSYIAIDSVNIKRSESSFLFVEYISEKDCSACSIKRLFRWENYLKDLQCQEKDVNALVIIETQIDKIEEITNLVVGQHLKIPVVLDISNTFLKDNKLLSADMMFKTFLLDKDRNVQIIGSPIDMPSLDSVVKEYLNSTNDDCFYIGNQ